MTRRVRSGVDTGRLSAAVQRPGIDPRVWLTLAVVTDVGFDPADGIFADVKFQPSGDAETCLVAAPYAGGGFGAYYPVRLDDTVLVAVPSGDPGAGPIIIARLWNAADKPAPEFGNGEEPSQDVSTLVEAGSLYRVSTDGANIEMTAEGATLKALGDLVELAVSPAAEAFVRGTSFAAALQTLLSTWSTQLGFQSGLAVALGAAHAVVPPGPYPDPGIFAAAALEVAGIALLQTQIASLQARLVPGDLLSIKVKGD